jgi:uncharacterized protein (TIGR04255 family)
MNYKINFLSKVIFQANYQPLPQLKVDIDKNLKDIISVEVGKEPVTSENQLVFFGIKPGSSMSEINKEIQWNFNGDSNRVLINSQWFQVITLKYTNFKDFHPLICKVFAEVVHVYNPNFNRIALRYINNVSFKEGSTFDFIDYIDDSLTSFSTKFKDNNLKRSMGVMEIKNEELNVNTKFNFGFFNSEYPNSISKREFVLDYDTSTIFNPKSDKIEDILQRLRANNNALFEKSIKEGLRNQMNK